MSNSRSGFFSDYAIALETTYGTAVAVSRSLPHVTALDLIPNPEKGDDETLRGFSGREKRFLGLTKIQGSLTSYGSFGETELLRAIAIGDSNIAGGGPPHVHTHDPADCLTRSCTLVQRLKTAAANEIREFAGVKVNNWTLSGTPGEPFTETFELVADSMTTTSVINTDVEMDAATPFGATRQVFRPSDVVFRLGSTGAALGAGDTKNPVSVEISVSNNMAIEDFGSDGLAEPARDGFRDVSLTVQLPRLDNTLFRSWAENNTELQAFLLLSSGGDTWEFRFPALTLGNPTDVIDGADLIRPTLDLMAHRAKGNNPTWPTIQEDIQVILTSALLGSDILP